MVSVLAVAAALTLTTPVETVRCIDDPGSIPAPSLRELYEGGRSFSAFHEGAERRRELWDGNFEKGAGIAAELVARAGAIPGTWRFLVVAVDSCSDSVSTIPYLARLVQMVEGLDLRVIDSDVGREIMEAHRTPDGRPSTPTVLLLDEAWNEVGCFVERPLTLRTWLLDNDITGDQVFPRKMEWYAEDSGASTVEEIVGILEAAAAGAPICG